MTRLETDRINDDLLTWRRFSRFMDGNVETGAGRVVHAAVYGLMGAAFSMVVSVVLGTDDTVYIGFHVPMWVNIAALAVLMSVTETSRRKFLRLKRRLPTRTERAVMGFRCSAGFMTFGFVGVFWLFGYDGSWPFLVFAAAAFVVFWTTMESRFTDRVWRRIEKQAGEREPPAANVT